jgi:putative phosphoesterase
MGNPLRILVIADTHDHLPPKLEELAAGMDEIWHLGDVCAPGLLDEIRAVGLPVRIVRGNCDSNDEWPLELDLEHNGIRFRLLHIPPNRIPRDVDVVLHGHTHVPRHERIGGVLFLNPGCVTRPNRGAPASVAYLDVGAAGQINWHLQTTR